MFVKRLAKQLLVLITSLLCIVLMLPGVAEAAPDMAGRRFNLQFNIAEQNDTGILCITSQTRRGNSEGAVYFDGKLLFGGGVNCFFGEATPVSGQVIESANDIKINFSTAGFPILQRSYTGAIVTNPASSVYPGNERLFMAGTLMSPSSIPAKVRPWCATEVENFDDIPK